MQERSLVTLKNSVQNFFTRYYTEDDKSWVAEVCGENPFITFRTVPDFKLVMPNEGLSTGEVEIENCKRVYENLKFLSESQAADERLWAGLCHDLFYNYVRRRFGYDANKTDFVTATDDETEKVNSADDKKIMEIINEIKNRFFLNGGARAELMQNPLARYWWTGRVFYDENNRLNHFEKLDLIGTKNFYRKIFSTMTRAFAANPKLLNGVILLLSIAKIKTLKLT